MWSRTCMSGVRSLETHRNFSLFLLQRPGAFHTVEAASQAPAHPPHCQPTMKSTAILASTNGLKCGRTRMRVRL